MNPGGIEMGISEVGRASDTRLIGLERLAQLAGVFQCDADIEVQYRIVRSEAKGVSVHCDRVRVTFRLEKDAAQVE